LGAAKADLGVRNIPGGGGGPHKKSRRGLIGNFEKNP